jgi:hypothetical protein
MRPISRRSFLGSASAVSALGVSTASPGNGDEASPTWPGGTIENAAFRLSLAPRVGLPKTQITHLPSGLLLADADYHYSFGPPEFSESGLVESGDGTRTVTLSGGALSGQLEVGHEFRVPRGQPWIEEQITLTNRSSHPLDLTSANCGFQLPLSLTGSQVSGPWSKFKFTAVPYRRGLGGPRGQYNDFSLGDILTQQFSFEPMWLEGTLAPNYASEAWALTDGEQGFAVLKYGQDGMEWSVLGRATLPSGQAALRWGGFGIQNGEPSHGAWLLPGESHPFGVTKLIAYEGGITEGFYAFRREMEARGHGCPQGFNPPVHWNELYDNKLWSLPGEEQGDPEMRKKYYTLDDMKAEAAKAQAIGCEALYLDPGWDTKFASKIWDEARLGPYRDFVAMLKHDHGLKNSLHTPLTGWCDPTAYPEEMYRVDRSGRRIGWEPRRGFGISPLCQMSRQYQEETARRLNALARDGAAFFMFDGNNYHGECWDPEHGHAIPARREEHIQGMRRLARMIHAEYPGVLIEMHNPDPVYYGHGRASPDLGDAEALGFDSMWGFELMWEPMDDLLSGRSMALYYYSLAYSLPLYLHIDLRTDNENALVFWWTASTCRHLGIGGTHAEEKVRQAHKSAMTAYRRLKPYFAAGTFYGLDEMTHLHRHPSQASAAINCFNLEDHAVNRTIEFDLTRVGLDPQKAYNVDGATLRRSGTLCSFEVGIPSHGHKLIVMD